MDPQGSTPDNQSSQDDYSSNDNSAEKVVFQPSDDGRPNFFDTSDGNDQNDQGDDDDTPSQTQNQDDNQDDQGDGNDNDDDGLDAWAKSQNIELDSDNARKLAQRLRDTQKAYHNKTTESKQKFKEASDEDTSDNTAARLEGRLARMDFFEANPGARELEGVMYDIALEARDSGDQAGFNYYQTPQGWKTLYTLAKSRDGDQSGDDQFNAGRQTERETLAKKQQASTARRQSQSSAPTNGRPSDTEIGNYSPKEYTDFRKANPDWDPYTGWQS